jgi:uncharacterized membrane protein YdfJ with MMPL/SSD domain
MPEALTMFARLGAFIYNKRWGVLAAGGLFIATGLLYGGGVSRLLKNGGFEDEKSESSQAARELQLAFRAGSADLVLLFQSDAWSASDPRFSAAVNGTLSRLNGRPGVAGVVSFYGSGAPELVSNDQHSTFAVVSLAGSDDEKQRTFDSLRPLLPSSELSLKIGLGMALALLIDATVVRSLLVPATMRLMGNLNWWAPVPLQRAWERWGLREAAPGTGSVSQPPATVLDRLKACFRQWAESDRPGGQDGASAGSAAAHARGTARHANHPGPHARPPEP